MLPSFDPDSNAFYIFHGHVKRAKYNANSACDGESILAFLSWGRMVPQLCILKGNMLRLPLAQFRCFYQEYKGPSMFDQYDNDVFWKYVYMQGAVIAPYFSLVIPLGLLNMLIVYRVAKECPGVWYHMAQTIGDIGELFFVLLDVTSFAEMFAPLFAWTNSCQMFAQAMVSTPEFFFAVFGSFGLALLTYDRYLCVCYPEKYSTHGSKVKIYLSVTAAIAMVPAIFIFLGWITQNNYPVLSEMFFVLFSLLFFLCFTISIGITVFCSIRTVKAAKHYQPPEGGSHAAETIDKMKRLHQLAVRVALLNVIFTLFMYWFAITYFIVKACSLAQNLNLVTPGGFCDIYLVKFEWAYELQVWTPLMLLFSSNTGLIFHCIFSHGYRDEVFKLFHEVIAWFRCQHPTPVVPLHE